MYAHFKKNDLRGEGTRGWMKNDVKNLLQTYETTSVKWVWGKVKTGTSGLC